MVLLIRILLLAVIVSLGGCGKKTCHEKYYYDWNGYSYIERIAIECER